MTKEEMELVERCRKRWPGRLPTDQVNLDHDDLLALIDRLAKVEEAAQDALEAYFHTGGAKAAMHALRAALAEKE